MGLFLSTTINKVDKKGRVSVPSSFRSALAHENFQGVVLFQSYKHPAIEGVGMAAMESIAQRMDDNFAFFSDDMDELATVLFGDSIQLAFDGDGRITLPQTLMDAVDIHDQAAFVGLGQKFQIWNPEKFEMQKNKSRQSVIDKKVTLPKGDQ